MTITEQLNRLQGHAAPDIPTSGIPARLWTADVVCVNPDGSVDCQPVQSRATKVGVPVPALYAPTIGDRVFVADLNGDARTPVVLGVLNQTRPIVTGSRAGNVALASLLTALAGRGLITDHTTT